MEIESKYALPDRDTGLRILSDPALTPLADTPMRSITMESVYYADPGGRLRRAGYTLRLRRENGVSICCLKQDKRAEGAVKHRRELECPAQTIAAGIAALIAAGAPDSFGAICENVGVTEVTRVSFLRRELRLGINGAVIALSFDEGSYGSRGNVPLLELEVELISGSESAFLDFTGALAERYALAPKKDSKYASARAAERLP